MENFEIVYEATDELLLQALELDKSAYAKLDVGDFFKCKQWLEKNKDIYTFLLYDKKVIGYINFVAITDSCFNKFLQGKMKDYKLSADDILPFKKGKNKGLIMSIVIREDFRDGQAIIELQNAFMDKLRRMKEQGTIFEEKGVIVDCISVDGVKYVITQYGAKYLRDSYNGKVFRIENIYVNPFTMTKVSFEKLSAKNLKQAGLIQYTIFPYWCGYSDYVSEVKKENNLSTTYLIKHKGNYVGVTGLNFLEAYPQTIWLNWFGILPQYRNQGVGTHALFKIIDIARKLGKKEFRLVTYKRWNKQAQRMYKKTMQISEYYKNPEDWQYAIKSGKAMIFSSSLKDKRVSKWNNKFINLLDDKILNDESVKKLKEDNVI